MNYFRSTGTSGGLLFTRTESAYLRDRTSEMLQAAALADAAVANGAGQASATLPALASRVLGVAGESWVAAAIDERVRRLARVANGEEFASIEDEAFDQLCSDVLRLRFPVETARETASPAWGMPRA